MMIAAIFNDVVGVDILYRVSFFSNWEKPRHFENVDREDAIDLRLMGRDRSYKVVLTLMTEEEPLGF